MKTITLLILLLSFRAFADTIPGLMPADVYLSLEEKGFTTDKQYNVEGSRFMCRRDEGGCTWSGQIYAPKGNSTKISVIVGLMQNQTGEPAKTTEWSKPFLTYMASLPYEGSTPAEAAAWVGANIGKNAEKQFGPVKMQLFSEGDSRMVRISMEPLAVAEATPSTLPTITHLDKPKVRDETAKLPEVGNAYTEVIAEHGKPSIQDADTGWAIWTSFKVKFKDGRAVEVAR